MIEKLTPLILFFVFSIATFGKSQIINLNSGSTFNSLKSATVPVKFDVAVKNSRAFEINPLFLIPENINIGDTLDLELFLQKNYLAVIESKSTDINHVTVYTSKLVGFQFAYCMISVSNETVLINIDVPEKSEKYTTRFVPGNKSQYLLQLDENDLDYLEGGEMPVDTVRNRYISPAVRLEMDFKPGSLLKSAEVGEGIDDPAQIDLLVVYTPAAASWADTFQGGINNTISQAIAECNLVSANSKLGINFNLAYSTVVDYKESGNSQDDMNNLTEGFVPNVHAIREVTGTDLVVFLTKISDVGGIASLLGDRQGNPESGFLISRVQQASGSLSAIHEIGHTLGAHHHKQQNYQPGPTYWSNWPENKWSAGWRWIENDTRNYCTVMTYASGWFFSDGKNSTVVPYFSDPNVLYQGIATGDSIDGNNARTIREMKDVISGYHEAARHDIPAVYTYSVIDSISGFATGGGFIVDKGVSDITSQGIVWSTHNNPNLEDNFTVNGNGIGEFTSLLTDLQIDSVYYVRAYATNNAGTSYGNQVSFVYKGGISRDFITCWELPEGQSKIELLMYCAGPVNYNWETIPAGQSGYGVIEKTGYIDNLKIENLPAGKKIRIKMAPENIKIFCNQACLIGLNPDADKLLDVEQWGTPNWENMENAFFLCVNLNISAKDIPDFSNVKEMNSMFLGCKKLDGPLNIGKWNVSNVRNMSYMFSGASVFNQNIGRWNVSNVTDMEGMFATAQNFNQEMGNWNVSKVANMNVMFFNAKSFNQDIRTWDVSNVRQMDSMFSGASIFNQDIGTWDVSNVVKMSWMFCRAESFDQNIGNWKVSKVKDMSKMFLYAGEFDQDIGNWDVSNVVNMSWMFYDAKSFNQDLVSWDVSNVTDMSSMFLFADNFNGDIGEWDVSNVADMSYMFYNANTFNQDLSSWNVSNVINMSSMFCGAKLFNSDIGKWNVSKATKMSSMFLFADNFNGDIGEWDVSSVKDMSSMFLLAESFNQNISRWDVSNVRNMSSMFAGASVFNQNIGIWNTSNVTNMTSMFFNAYEFNSDISNWDVSKVSNMSYMFCQARKFNQDIGKWELEGRPDLEGMLSLCGMDCSNYSSTLVGWSSNPSTPDSLNLGAYKRVYSSAIVAERDTLIQEKRWTITADALSDGPGNASQILGLESICSERENIIYSIPSVEYASSYKWTLPDGAIGESNNNTISVSYFRDAISGYIAVRGVNACGEGTETRKYITVNPVPSNEGIVSGDTIVCQGQTVNYMIPEIENATSYQWTLPEGATGTSSTNTISVTYGSGDVSGNISVLGINACGESDESKLSVTVNPTPAQPVITRFEDKLIVSESSGVQWYDDNGLIQDENNQNFFPGKSGSYHVVVSTEFCCSPPSKTYLFFLTGVETYLRSNSIRIYPNPVSDELTLKSDDLINEVRFEIIYATGQTVMQDKFTGETSISMKKLVPGTYLIKFENDDFFEFKKVIKK